MQHEYQQQQQYQSHAQHDAHAHDHGAGADHSQEEHHQPHHYPPQHQRVQGEQMTMQNAAPEEMDLQQRIAQKMLTSQAPPRSGYDNRRQDYPDAYFENVAINQIAEPQLLPPWETDATGAARHDHNLQAGDLPVSQLHQAMHPSLNFNNIAIADNNTVDFDMAHHNLQAGDLPVSQLHQAMHPSLNFNNIAIADNNTVDFDMAQGQVQSMADEYEYAPVETPMAPVPINKRVSFLTQDQFFLWDEQLDISKCVDAEYFNVAHFLLDVVGAKNANFDEYMLNIASFEQEELKRGSGLLSILFGCSAAGATGAIEDDDKQQQQRGRDDDKAIKYQLTEKLVNDFFTATKFRMESIESKSSGGEEVEENEGATARTKEIVRKINAYGLPLLGSDAKIDTRCDENESPTTQTLGLTLDGIVEPKEKGEAEEEDEEIVSCLKIFPDPSCLFVRCLSSKVSHMLPPPPRPNGDHGSRPCDDRSVPPRNVAAQQVQNNPQHPMGQRQRPALRPVPRAVDSRISWLDDLLSEF